jgi:uncharacterized protein with PIN domain
MPAAEFRFFQELNDFLPPEQRKCWIPVTFKEGDTVKNLIEARGIPHTEIDLLTVGGQPVDFSYQVRQDDRICVYPVFESFDISGLTRVRAGALRVTRFILDVHLGRLARDLRMLGFDTEYAPPFDDADLVARAGKQHRVILTRDRALLMRKAVTHGYLVRSLEPDEQLREVLRRFQLEESIRPFTRCLLCNSELRVLPVRQARERVPALVYRLYEDFRECPRCGQVFWEGSHWRDMKARLGELISDTRPQ